MAVLEETGGQNGGGKELITWSQIRLPSLENLDQHDTQLPQARGIKANVAPQSYVLHKMDHHAHRTNLFGQFAGYLLRRPNMVDKQEPLVCWLLA